MGINEVSRCIEKNQLACCLIAEDVANSVIAKHLLLMTAAKKIPVLIISDLHSITKRIIGFSSVTIGLKVCIISKSNNS
jgi:ribosomal protein L7Ae-like RNA K-turn-binding protein